MANTLGPNVVDAVEKRSLEHRDDFTFENSDSRVQTVFDAVPALTPQLSRDRARNVSPDSPQDAEEEARRKQAKDMAKTVRHA